MGRRYQRSGRMNFTRDGGVVILGVTGFVDSEPDWLALFGFTNLVRGVCCGHLSDIVNASHPLVADVSQLYLDGVVTFEAPENATVLATWTDPSSGSAHTVATVLEGFNGGTGSFLLQLCCVDT